MQDASDPAPRKDKIKCSKCSSLVGLEDIPSGGWRLLKASLAVTTSSGNDSGSEEPTWESHSTETVVAAQLLELIERESARRFVVHTGGNSGLLV